MLLATIVCTSAPYIFAEPVRIEANGKPIDVTTGHAAPLVYDFDGDGIRDLLVGEFGSGEFSGPVHTNVEGAHKWNNGRLRFYKNNGTNYDMKLGDWKYVEAGDEVAVVPITCCVSFVPQFIDYNNDGIDDIISASYPGDMYAFIGDGEGNYAKPIHLQNEDGEPLLAWEIIPEKYRKDAKTERQTIHSTTMELHDMDADGDLDIYVGSRLDGCFTIENKGSRSEPIWSNTTEVLKDINGNAIGGWDWGSNIHWHDWDGDGISDVLVGSEDGAVRWYRNVGEDTKPQFGEPVLLIPAQTFDEMFEKLETPARSGSRCKVHATDWDGDGVTDLLVGDFGSSWKQVKTLTAKEESELEHLDSERNRISNLAMPLWNMDRDLNAEEKKELNRLDELLSEIYEKQQVLETHTHSSHGWVWLYRQVKNTLIQKQTPHVNIAVMQSSLIQPGKQFGFSVIFNIEHDWSLSAAGVDAEGLPTTINLSLPDGFTLKQINWPALNSRGSKPGYQGQTEVNIELEAPTTLPDDITIELESSWQVCSNTSGLCVRGKAILEWTANE